MPRKVFYEKVRPCVQTIVRAKLTAIRRADSLSGIDMMAAERALQHKIILTNGSITIDHIDFYSRSIVAARISQQKTFTGDVFQSISIPISKIKVELGTDQ